MLCLPEEGKEFGKEKKGFMTFLVHIDMNPSAILPTDSEI
jgi:hypothetical protein